jgi:hypothetical protein
MPAPFTKDFVFICLASGTFMSSQVAGCLLQAELRAYDIHNLKHHHAVFHPHLGDEEPKAGRADIICSGSKPQDS